MQQTYDPRRIELEMLYSPGVAGQEFLRRLKEEGSLTASRCKKCGATVMPPRIYCLECFSNDIEFIPIKPRGRIYTYTVAYVDGRGNRLENPVIYAIISFDGVKGGITHRVNASPENVRIGMEVEAVLRPSGERRGELNDIIHFEPVH